MTIASLEKITKFCKGVDEKQRGKDVDLAVVLAQEEDTSVAASAWLDDLEVQRLFEEGNGTVGGNVPLLLYLSQKEERRHKVEKNKGDGQEDHTPNFLG